MKLKFMAYLNKQLLGPIADKGYWALNDAQYK